MSSAISPHLSLSLSLSSSQPPPLVSPVCLGLVVWLSRQQVTSFHSALTTPTKHCHGRSTIQWERIKALSLTPGSPPSHVPHGRSPSAGSAELESAVLSPSHETLLSDLFQQPAELSTLHTSPIPMPSHPGGSHSREPGMESGPHSMERGM